MFADFANKIILILFCLGVVASLHGQPPTDSTMLSEVELLVKKADQLYNNGQSSAAFSLLEKAQLMDQSRQNWNHYIECWIIMARYLDGHPDIARRMNYIDRAIRDTKQFLSGEDKLLVQALQQKGEIYLALGKLDSAKLVLSDAEAIGEKVEAWEDLAWVLMIHAATNYYQGDFQAMKINIDRAIALAENRIKAPDDHLALITTLQSLLFDATGDYENAFIASQKTLNRQIETPTDTTALANAYNNHGAICFERGDFDQAIHHYKIAIDLFQKKGNDVKSLIQLNINLSLCYKRKADLERANAYLENSKALLPEKTDAENYQDWIRTHQLMASNKVDQKDFAGAMTLLEKLLPLSQHFQYDEHWIQASMGRALLELEEAPKAKDHFNIALSKNIANYGAKHPNVARMYRYLGKTYAVQQQPAKALEYFQMALTALSSDSLDNINFENPKLESIHALTEFLHTLEDKAKTLERLVEQETQSQSSALSTYRLAIATIDKMREDYETEEAKLLLNSSAKRIYENTIQLLHALYHKNNAGALLAEAFQYAEKSKSLLLLETIRSTEAREKANPLYANDTLFYDLLQSGKSIKRELVFFEKKLAEVQKANLDREHPKRKNTESKLARLYQENLKWKTKMETHYPAYYHLQYDQGLVDIDLIQKEMLGEKDALLEYFIGQNRAFLFVISSNDVHWFQIQIDSEWKTTLRAFEEALLDYRALNTDAEKALRHYNKTAYQLYKILLEEALARLPAGVDQMTIVPDGDLNRIPFEALTSELSPKVRIDFGQLPYLINDFQVHYGYSATLLLHNQDRYQVVPPNRQCLALAPPYAPLQAQGNGSLRTLRNNHAALAGAVDEIRQMAQFFPGQYNVGPTATEYFFKQEATRFGILHLAMHGVANYEHSNFGHLKFTNLSGDTLEDNLLYHYEIADMKLNCQLATLSACETGLGKYEEGEGVFSLARSFMYAGVPSVVMSLWKIDDQSTGQLIPLFYKNLAKGWAKDVALQKAKQEFLAISDIELRHPYYWSGMVLLGEEQALKEKSNPFKYLGPILLLFVSMFFVRKYLV